MLASRDTLRRSLRLFGVLLCLFVLGCYRDILERFTPANNNNSNNSSSSSVAYDVKVTLSGTGRGQVISMPDGIDCGARCQARLSAKSGEFLPSLAAVAEPGSLFVRWSGMCSGMDSTCVVKNNGDVTAVFAPSRFEQPRCSRSGWCWEFPRPQGNTLNSIHGTSAQDVWVAGNAGTLLHWDGSRWSFAPAPDGNLLVIRSGPAGTRCLLTKKADDTGGIFWDSGNGVWGDVSPEFGKRYYGLACTSDGEMWTFSATDDKDTAWHRDRAGNWTSKDMKLPTGGFVIYAIWSNTSDQVWAVGRRPGGGLILKWTGSEWVMEFSGVTQSLLAISGRAPDDMWALGDEGSVLHRDGRGLWSETVIPGEYLRPSAIWSQSAGSAWVTARDTSVWRWQDGAWQLQTSQTSSSWYSFPTLLSIWSADPQRCWAVGERGLIMYWDGEKWEAQTPLPPETNYFGLGVWQAPDQIVWATQDTNAVFRLDRANLSKFYTGDYVSFSTLWGSASDDIWGFGYSHFLHFDGKVWSETKTLSSVEWTTRNSAWGSSARDIWVVGNKGVIDHWNGMVWEQITTSPTKNSLTGIWGSSASSVWAIGDAGTLLRWDGKVWVREPSTTLNTQADLKAIWGTGANDIWIVGSGGECLHNGGTGWVRVPTQTKETLHAIWGHEAGDVWAVGGQGTILHWDGRTWRSHDSGTDRSLLRVWNAHERTWVMAAGPALLSHG